MASRRPSAVPTIQVGAVVSTTELIVKLDAGSYDVVVLDYVMPGQQYGDGLTLLPIWPAANCAS